MSTILRILKAEGKLIASNREGTVSIDLSLDHPADKLFPPGKAVVFAKCRVANGKVTVINPCKPWKGGK